MFKASAPGSLMLLGEHAVLHRQHALVCAIDQRIHVTLIPRTDQKITIESVLGHYSTTLTQLNPVAPFQFVLCALQIMRPQLKQGCDIKITAEFSATIGFASSAAVTVATLAALLNWLTMSYSEDDLIKLARKVIQRIQGIGSGADAAACVKGGIVLYRMQPFHAEKYILQYPISVVYSGYKTPTTTVIKLVTEKFATTPALHRDLMKAINQCVLEGVSALQKENWVKFGEIMNIQQGLLDALGVNDATMSNIINTLRQQPTILGAKISGSGLGDCVIGLGDSVVEAYQHSSIKKIAVNMTSVGVQCEKN